MFSPFVNKNNCSEYWGTQWCSLLRHCTTSTGSIPDGAIGIFHSHNPSSHTVALRLTQPLTEMSTRNISWGLSWPVHRDDNLTTFMCQLSWNLGASTPWNPQGLSRLVMGLLYLLPWRLVPIFQTLWHYFLEDCNVNWHGVSNNVYLMCGWPCIVIQYG